MTKFSGLKVRSEQRKITDQSEKSDPSSNKRADVQVVGHVELER